MTQEPICLSCKHFQRDDIESRSEGTGRCAAYPEKIPVKFYSSEADHFDPVDGDNGIQFEMDPDMKDVSEEFIQLRREDHEAEKTAG
jgi:hypothetical protein